MSFFTNHNPNNSFEVAQPPTDSVSSLSFSPKSNLLVSTSWDNQVRCWDVQKIGTSIAATPKSSYSHDQPVLCSMWKDDGMAVFSGGCDRQVKMWSLMSGGQPTTVAMHDAPIKEIAWIPELALLVAGSWDKTLKYWDLRQPNPVHTQLLPERCYALTVKYPLMVVGTADRNLIMFNLHNPQTEFKRIISPLKYQTRCVAAFPDQQGFLVGSIEGRVGVQHLNEGQESKNFTFKCHRENNVIYSVNSINFHPVYHTFATAGSDGSISFWDKDSKQRLKAMSKCNQPIPCSTFNNDGSIFAYSESGVSGLNSKTHMKILLKWMRGRKMLKLFPNQVGSNKKFLLCTLPEDPHVTEFINSTAVKVQSKKPSSKKKKQKQRR